MAPSAAANLSGHPWVPSGEMIRPRRVRARPCGKSGGEADCQRGGVEGDVKCTPEAERALGPDAPAVLLDDALADRQTQASATFDPRIRRVHLLKPIEDDLELVGGDAAALVGDAEAHLAAVDNG